MDDLNQLNQLNHFDEKHKHTEILVHSDGEKHDVELKSFDRKTKADKFIQNGEGENYSINDEALKNRLDEYFTIDNALDKIKKMQDYDSKAGVKAMVPAQYMGMRGHRKAGSRAKHARKAADGYRKVALLNAKLANEINPDDTVANVNLRLDILKQRLKAMIESIKVTATDANDEKGRIAMADLKISVLKYNLLNNQLNQAMQPNNEDAVGAWEKERAAVQERIAADKEILKKLGKLTIEGTEINSQEELLDKEMQMFDEASVNAPDKEAYKAKRINFESATPADLKAMRVLRKEQRYKQNVYAECNPVLKKEKQDAEYFRLKGDFSRLYAGFLGTNKDRSEVDTDFLKATQDKKDVQKMSAYGMQIVRETVEKACLDFDKVEKAVNGDDVEQKAAIYRMTYWSLTLTKYMVINKIYMCNGDEELMEAFDKFTSVMSDLYPTATSINKARGVGSSGSGDVDYRQPMEMAQMSYDAMKAVFNASLKEYKDYLSQHEKTLKPKYPFFYNRNDEGPIKSLHLRKVTEEDLGRVDMNAINKAIAKSEKKK